LTVENILAEAGHDIWAVNVEEEYHEEALAPADGEREPAASRTGRDAPVVSRAAFGDDHPVNKPPTD
jgi:hypothetical protein